MSGRIVTHIVELRKRGMGERQGSAAWPGLQPIGGRCNTAPLCQAADGRALVNQHSGRDI